MRGIQPLLLCDDKPNLHDLDYRYNEALHKDLHLVSREILPY